MPYVDLDEFKMYYEEAGDGEPLVFLHGFSIDHRQWRPQRDYFSSNYHVICPDARGHGKSEVTRTGYSRKHRVEDLKGFVDTLGLEKFHLVGLSFGGSTAIGFALERQTQLRSLTLVSTGAAGYSAGKKIDRLDKVGRDQSPETAKQIWMQWTLAWYQEDRTHLRDFMRDMMEDYSAAVWHDPMRGKYPREYDLEKVHQIEVPTLIVTGRLDRIFVPLSEKIHQKISSSRLIIYDDVGHMINLEAPEKFNRDLQEFLISID